MGTWDVVVIGAGAVGENAAARVAAGGLSAVIVESELVGGECSYWACMPSKALLRSGAVRRAAAHVRGSGVHLPAGPAGAVVEPGAVLARRNGFTSDWDDAGQVSWLDSVGIDLVRGHGRIAGVRSVEVSTAERTEMLHARHAVVVCTGSDPAVPSVLAEVAPWTSREATSAEEIPERLAIVGAGVVGVEMATAYRDLGARVTLLVRGRVLPGSEPFAGERVAQVLRETGVDVRIGVSVTHAARDADTGVVRLTCDDGQVVEADEVLAATGRRPRNDDLGLSTVGLADGEWLQVDETMRVAGSDWLYAVGDVNHRALLTHQGKYQARAAGDAIAARSQGREVSDHAWGTHAATADHEAVPQVAFSDPEVASVGLTAAEAEESGYPVRVVDYELGSVAGAALHADDYAGMARMVVDTEREVILGVTFVGPDVAELLHAATIAVVGQVPIDRLWHAVPAYPTISEVWLRLLEGYGRP